MGNTSPGALSRSTIILLAATSVVTIVAALAIILLLNRDDSSTNEPAEREPTRPGVASQLQPGDTFVSTERVYRRYGPAAGQIIDTIPRVGPETQIVSLASTFDADGCVAEVSTTRAAEDGAIIEQASSTPGDGTLLGGAVAGICLDDFRRAREDIFHEILALPGAAIISETGDHIGIRTDAPPIQPSASGSDLGLPYTEDLDLAGRTMRYTFRADTLERHSYELRATLTDGSIVVLERHEIISEVIT